MTWSYAGTANDSTTYSGTTPPTKAGSYTATASVAADNANYLNAASSSATAFTIATASASVTANPQAKTYGANNPTLTATVLGQVVGGDTINYTLATDATQFSSVGVSNIFVTLGSNPNYSVLATNSTLTISAASPAFSGLSSVTNSYGVTNIILTGAVSAAGTLYPTNGETISAKINGFVVNGTVTNGTGNFLINYNDPSLATNGVNGSAYAITYNYAGDGNLAAAANSSTSLKITNALLSITGNNDSKVYGSIGSSYGPGLTNFTSSGLENGETIGTVTITASDTPSGTGARDPVGNYDLTPSAATNGTFNPTNYLITYVNGTLTVNRASTSVGASSSENPSGYQDAVSFQATLPADATGSVLFRLTARSAPIT